MKMLFKEGIIIEKKLYYRCGYFLLYAVRLNNCSKIKQEC